VSCGIGRRQWHESESDLLNEQGVAIAISRAWRVIPVKLPVEFRVDYALFRGEDIKAWAEVKCRRVERQKYPTYIVSLAKVKAGQRLALAHGVPFLLVVQWADATGWVIPTLDDVRVGGRRDRGESLDIEPMVHIPISSFKRL